MKNIGWILIFCWLTGGLFAQEAEEKSPQVEKYENVDWFEVVLVDFKAGKVDKAKEYLELFEKAAKKAGTPIPEMHWILTGEFDLMIIWEYENGPSDLEWRYSPKSLKWWDALVEQQGGSKNAEILSDSYGDIIARSNSMITMKARDKK